MIFLRLKYRHPEAKPKDLTFKILRFAQNDGLKVVFSLITALFFIVSSEGCTSSPKPVTVRIGHFPNITHAQAVIGHASHAFEYRLAPEAVIDWKIFNAGPSAIEALFAGHLDIAYLGPSPAVNGYVKSQGEAIRVIAGAASGGAALLVHKDSGIQKVNDFRNKKIATPQLGNTQDVSLRSWLSKNELKLNEVGGDVQVLPLANADQQTLFLRKEIDASWTVEPWVSILTQNADARVFLEESSLWPDGDYCTALVVVRKKFLDEHPDLVKNFLEVHVTLTQWINENPAEAQSVLKSEIAKETGKEMPDSILTEALKRVRFIYDPLPSSVAEQSHSAFLAGYLKKEPDLKELFDFKLLNEVLENKKLEAVVEK